MLKKLSDEDIKNIQHLFNIQKYTKTKIAELYKGRVSLTTICLWIDPEKARLKLQNKRRFHVYQDNVPRCKICASVLHRDEERTCNWCYEDMIRRNKLNIV